MVAGNLGPRQSQRFPERVGEGMRSFYIFTHRQFVHFSIDNKAKGSQFDSSFARWRRPMLTSFSCSSLFFVYSHNYCSPSLFKITHNRSPDKSPCNLHFVGIPAERFCTGQCRCCCLGGYVRIDCPTDKHLLSGLCAYRPGTNGTELYTGVSADFFLKSHDGRNAYNGKINRFSECKFKKYLMAFHCADWYFNLAHHLICAEPIAHGVEKVSNSDGSFLLCPGDNNARIECSECNSHI